MYTLQTKPDDLVKLKNGTLYRPVITLRDEYGGVSHIVRDGPCYVLVNGTPEDGFEIATHWYAEVIGAVKGLPTLEGR